MNYIEGVKHMHQLCHQVAPHPLYTHSFEPYDDIIIQYPGRKYNGDYRMNVSSFGVPTHIDISTMLYDLIIDNHFTYQTIKTFLTDIYNNGTNTTYNNNKLTYLQHLIYWVTLQEEINYPRAKNYAGINLAFCRFFEAIYATQPDSPFTLTDVLRRCNNHGSAKPSLYNLATAASFYHY